MSQIYQCQRVNHYLSTEAEMLVLSRRVGERIRISKDIFITVLEIKGRREARIGIEAPKKIPVVREELIAKKPKAA